MLLRITRCQEGWIVVHEQMLLPSIEADVLSLAGLRCLNDKHDSGMKQMGPGATSLGWRMLAMQPGHMGIISSVLEHTATWKS